MTHDRPLYKKPTILAIGTDKPSQDSLSQQGFSVDTGSLGNVYCVPKEQLDLPVVWDNNLPEVWEHDIVVIDLQTDLLTKPYPAVTAPYGAPCWHANTENGYIDTRPLVISAIKDKFSRIFSHKGCVVVFTSKEYECRFSEMVRSPSYRISADYDDDELDALRSVSLGCHQVLLNQIFDLKFSCDPGNLMFAEESSEFSEISALISQHSEGALFHCLLDLPVDRYRPWYPLASNKFGNVIAALGQIPGLVIIVPQLSNKAVFLNRLFTQVLPKIQPDLFPDHQLFKWTEDPEYEFEAVSRLKREKEQILEHAKSEEARLNQEIAKERSEEAWQHNLLKETGDALVEAVIKALAQLGFSKVVDMDKERDQNGQTRKEDLQIHEKSPVLIVDIKGITGTPADEDTNQAHKHMTMYVKKHATAAAQGLSIINHQRYLAPHARDKEPFRNEIVGNAEETSCGLMTTWDVYKIMKDMHKWNWRPEDVKPIFYRTGRICPRPEHYEPLGTVTHVYQQAIALAIEHTELTAGARISFAAKFGYEEIKVDSIQLDSKPIEKAEVGITVGVGIKSSIPGVKVGAQVYLIRQTEAL